jgi:hypothetical protein
MSIRNTIQLYDALSQELAWRRKELSLVKSMVERRDSAPSKEATMLRMAVTLLYAHWEGFIKLAGEYYLEYVAMQKLRHDQLAPNFVALAIKGRLTEAMNSRKASGRNEVVRFFLEDFSKRSNLPHQGVILTSNLSSLVLQDIVDTLGFDYSGYATKENLINERLLGTRNIVAHGKWMSIDVEQYVELHDQVLSMMELFKNQIENAATTKQYKLK